MPNSATRVAKERFARSMCGSGPVVWQRLQTMFQTSDRWTMSGGRMKVELRGTQRCSGISHVKGNPTWVLPAPFGTQKTCMWCEPVTRPSRASTASGAAASGPVATTFSIRTQNSLLRWPRVKRVLSLVSTTPSNFACTAPGTADCVIVR